MSIFFTVPVRRPHRPTKLAGITLVNLVSFSFRHLSLSNPSLTHFTPRIALILFLVNVDEGLHVWGQHVGFVSDALLLDDTGGQALQRRELHRPHHLVQLLPRARQQVGERPPAAVDRVQVGAGVQQRLFVMGCRFSMWVSYFQ